MIVKIPILEQPLKCLTIVLNMLVESSMLRESEQTMINVCASPKLEMQHSKFGIAKIACQSMRNRCHDLSHMPIHTIHIP